METWNRMKAVRGARESGDGRKEKGLVEEHV